MIIPVPIVVLLGVIVLGCLALSGWAMWQLKESHELYMYSRNAEENLRTSLAELEAKHRERHRDLERVRAFLDKTIVDRDEAQEERDAARRERNNALAEKLDLIRQRDQAVADTIRVSKELSAALQDRDVALEKCKMAARFEDKLLAEIDQNIAALTKLQAAVNSLADLPSDRSNEQ